MGAYPKASCYFSYSLVCHWSFNNLLSDEDKKGGASYPNWLKNGFRSAIDECALVEIPLDGHPYTWAKNHGSCGWVEERLDRAFATAAWGHLFPQAILKNLLATVSDHSPICLETTPRVSHFYQRKFKFENMWLTKPELNDVVH